MPLAVYPGALAWPPLLVPTVAVFEPLDEKVPPAPLDGAVKVTGTPASSVVTGQPFVFASVTWSISSKGWCSLAVCGLPPTRVSVFGEFGVGQGSETAGAGLLRVRAARAATSASRGPREPRTGRLPGTSVLIGASRP